MTLRFCFNIGHICQMLTWFVTLGSSLLLKFIFFYFWTVEKEIVQVLVRVDIRRHASSVLLPFEVIFVLLYAQKFRVIFERRRNPHFRSFWGIVIFVIILRNFILIINLGFHFRICSFFSSKLYFLLLLTWNFWRTWLIRWAKFFIKAPQLNNFGKKILRISTIRW